MGVSRTRSGPYFWRSPFVTCDLLKERFTIMSSRCNHHENVTLYTTVWKLVMWWVFENLSAERSSTLYAPWYCPTCNENGETSEWRSFGSTYVIHTMTKKNYELLINHNIIHIHYNVLWDWHRILHHLDWMWGNVPHNIVSPAIHHYGSE